MSNLKAMICISMGLSVLISSEIIEAETVLNNQRDGHQGSPCPVRLSNGNLLVGWGTHTPIQDGPYFGIFREDLSHLYENDINVAEFFVYAFGAPKMAASEDSFFVGAFRRRVSGTSDTCIFIRKFDNSGLIATNDIRVNEYSSGSQYIQKVLIDDITETIFVVWESRLLSNPAQRNYYMRALDFNLDPISNDIAVYAENDESTRLADVGILSSSKIIFTFDHSYDIHFANVLAKYMDFNGSNQSDLFIVNSQQIGTQACPSISRIPGGGVLIVWSEVSGFYEASIRGKRFDSNGNPVDFTDLLLTPPDSNGNGICRIQREPQAAINSMGDTYFLCWLQNISDSNSSPKLMGRFLDFTLQPISDTFTISTTGGCDYPEVLELWPNNFAITWDMTGDPGYSTDIYGTIVPYPNTEIDYEFVQLPEFQSFAYPNPFNSSTTIKLELDRDSYTSIEVFDILGRRVNTLLNEYLGSGGHQISFSAAGLPSGTYFYRIQTDQFTESQKLTLLK